MLQINQINLAGKKNLILTTVAFVSILFAVYFFIQFNQLKANPQKIDQEEAAATIKAVGKLMVLPTGETPTVATVTDPSKLQGQAFFANAKTGDKVLVYTDSRKAILYDPSQNKIVEVAPINIGAPAK